jgi:hypothetical protein
MTLAGHKKEKYRYVPCPSEREFLVQELPTLGRRQQMKNQKIREKE